MLIQTLMHWGDIRPAKPTVKHILVAEKKAIHQLGNHQHSMYKRATYVLEVVHEGEGESCSLRGGEGRGDQRGPQKSSTSTKDDTQETIWLIDICKYCIHMQMPP